MPGPTKYDLVGYISGLQAIVAAQDTAGTYNRSTVLGNEAERAIVQLETMLKEEQNEPRRDSSADAHNGEAAEH